ncbi:MAG: YaiI/YqxD family protein [Magnetococcales bacterium]|nr:YaiI/YqxD family protein [Magnetococcales bacterium]
MMEIYVDGDACPVKAETVRVAERHKLIVHMVSNQWMRLPDSRCIRQTVVSEGADKADDWIAERAGLGDVVVTADIPLAARCLENKAIVVGPTGRPFDEESIGMALAMRDLHANLRECSDFQGRVATFGKKDLSRFLSSLEEAVRRAAKQDVQ